MRNKKILVLIIIALIVVLFASILIIKLKQMIKRRNTYNIRSKYHKDEKNSLFTKKIKNTKNKKYKKILLALNSCFMFLNVQDFINIKNLNKAYYKQIEKLIFKQIFIKRNKNFLKSRIDLNNKEKHFEMWFIYLKYEKNKINYKTTCIFINYMI